MEEGFKNKCTKLHPLNFFEKLTFSQLEIWRKSDGVLNFCVVIEETLLDKYVIMTHRTTFPPKALFWVLVIERSRKRAPKWPDLHKEQSLPITQLDISYQR